MSVGVNSGGPDRVSGADQYSTSFRTLDELIQNRQSAILVNIEEPDPAGYLGDPQTSWEDGLVSAGNGMSVSAVIELLNNELKTLSDLVTSLSENTVLNGSYAGDDPTYSELNSILPAIGDRGIISKGTNDPVYFAYRKGDSLTISDFKLVTLD